MAAIRYYKPIFLNKVLYNQWLHCKIDVYVQKLACGLETLEETKILYKKFKIGTFSACHFSSQSEYLNIICL